MKKSLLAAILLLLGTYVQAQLNMTFRSNLPYPGEKLANIGGYVDSSGNEYALVGYESGLSIVDVTDPDNPVEVFTVPGTQSTWREVKTWENYAYVTTEGCCNGLQVVNLGYLPDSVTSKYWKGSGAINNQLETIHALHIDEGFAYLFGSNLFNGAAVIADLSDPWNPVYTGFTPGTYIHDGYVRNDVLYAGHIYDGYFSVFDVSDKTNPVLIQTQSTPGQFTHNTWLNDAGNVLFTTDEVSNSYLASYDISDLSNITELDRLQVTPNSGSVVHNTHTLNDYEIVSWYKDGVVIVDVARPGNMIVTGWYDTYNGGGNGFNGAWGVYPYLPSGNLVVSDIDNGLFVITPDYIRGCYLEGNITDSISGVPLNGVTVEILTQNIIRQSKLNGDYKTGLATAGTYSIQFSKPGYITKIISGVALQNGVLTTLDVQLTSLPTVTASGQVISNVTGQPVANAIVNFSNSQFDVSVNTDINGQYSISGFYPGNYDYTIGAWGYRTVCGNNLTIGATALTTTLDQGHYDDFSLDFGWTVSGTSQNAWEIADPVATYNNSSMANPGSDNNTDCGDLAFVTDNGGGGPWDHDVDGGNTILTSPVFDLTGYINPVISYYRWFYNGGTVNGNPNDTMTIKLSNGISTVLLESMYPGTAGNGTWQWRTFSVPSGLAITANMQLIIEISDPPPVSNITEGGFDLFEVNETVGLHDLGSIASAITAYPNPFSNSIKIQLNSKKDGSILFISDVTGRLIETVEPDSEGAAYIGEKYSSGIYIVSDGLSKIRINKLN